MIDSGSTTLMMARFLAFPGAPCTVVTNNFSVAMALDLSEKSRLIICPGDYFPSEHAVVGPDTTEFLERHQVNRCVVEASGFSAAGPFEVLRGGAAVKPGMLLRSTISQLLVDCGKFGRKSLALVGQLAVLASFVCDAAPMGDLAEVLEREKGRSARCPHWDIPRLYSGTALSMFCDIRALHRAAWRGVTLALDALAGSHGRKRRLRRSRTGGFCSTTDTYVFDK